MRGHQWYCVRKEMRNEWVKKKLWKSLEEYYVVFADFLKFNNAKGNDTYNQQQAARKQRELDDIQGKLTVLQNTLQKIDATNTKISGTKKQIKELDEKLYQHNSNMLTQEQNIDKLRDEHASRIQQVNINIEKNITEETWCTFLLPSTL